MSNLVLGFEEEDEQKINKKIGKCVLLQLIGLYRNVEKLNPPKIEQPRMHIIIHTC